VTHSFFQISAHLLLRFLGCGKQLPENAASIVDANRVFCDFDPFQVDGTHYFE
jgi:hypothetical protein